MRTSLTFDEVLRSLRTEGVCGGTVDPQAYHAMKPMLEKALGVPVVSKSTLHDFSKGAYKFHWNKLNKVEKKTESMALGSLVDCLALTPELFEEQYLCEEKKVAVKKDGTPYANGQQDAEQKARWEAAATEGVTVISMEQKAKGEMIAAQAVKHLAERGIVLGETATSQFAVWVYMTEIDGAALATPVVVTGMFDILPHEGDEIQDLKSTSVEVDNFEKVRFTIEDFGYGEQGAMYLDLYNAYKPEDARTRFSFLFVGTSEPVMSRFVEMSPVCIEIYRDEYRAKLRKYALAWKSQDWGNAELETRIFMPSAREMKRIQKGGEA